MLSSRNALPPILWVLLITGWVLTVALSYFFGVDTTWIHGVGVASLSGLICFCLFLLAGCGGNLDNQTSGVGDEFATKALAVCEAALEDKQAAASHLSRALASLESAQSALLAGQ